MGELSLQRRQVNPRNETGVSTPTSYKVTMDMLLTTAFCPSVWLERCFPQTPFLRVAGKIPLAVWFSRVKLLSYHQQDGSLKKEGASEAILYNELNIAALLRRPGVFVPGIYASVESSILIGRSYGMPKKYTAMYVKEVGGKITSRAEVGGYSSLVQARIVTNGRFTGRLLSKALPFTTWPVSFPSGSSVRARIERIPQASLAVLDTGKLAVEESWFHHPLKLMPLGVYFADLELTLPPPDPRSEALYDPLIATMNAIHSPEAAH